MWWAIAVTIAALMAWVAWYEREQRREFQRMMKEHNIQVREMNGHYRPLENDFVHLEGRVDDLAEDVRELRKAVEQYKPRADNAKRRYAPIDGWSDDWRRSFHRAVCDYFNKWDWNQDEGLTPSQPHGGLHEIMKTYGYYGKDMKRFFTRHFMTAAEYDTMMSTKQVPEHFAEKCQ